MGNTLSEALELSGSETHTVHWYQTKVKMWDDNGFGDTRIIDPCSLAYLYDRNNFNFCSNYVTSLDRKREMNVGTVFVPL